MHVQGQGRELERVGKTCIITFPNFGHWRCRWYL
ncbi:methionine biosynthesis protein MetW, partial [Pseudomonas paraeruginosa]